MDVGVACGLMLVALVHMCVTAAMQYWFILEIRNAMYLAKLHTTIGVAKLMVRSMPDTRACQQMLQQLLWQYLNTSHCGGGFAPACAPATEDPSTTDPAQHKHR